VGRAVSTGGRRIAAVLQVHTILAAALVCACAGPRAPAPIEPVVAEVASPAPTPEAEPEPILASASAEAPTPAGLLVVIDPGHGGEKRGAVGPNRLQEKDAALAISLALRDELEAMGHRVVLTREADRTLGLVPRIRLANELGADVFVSVHLNAVPAGAPATRAQGVETYFLSADASDAGAAALARAENEDDVELAAGEDDPLGAILADLARTEAHVHSSRLAFAIQSTLVRAIGARDRGLKQAPFVVLQGAGMPAVLVEVGYVSHPEEARRLADPAHQRRIAAGIAEGIEAFGRDVIEREPRQAARLAR